MPLADHVGVQPGLDQDLGEHAVFGWDRAVGIGNPIAASVMQAIALRVWLRPVNRPDRVGEHSAVVCHWV